MGRRQTPKRFLFWEALPKSAYGEIAKILIREALQACGAQADPAP